MGGIEKFLARSVKDIGADDIVAALFSKVGQPGPRRAPSNLDIERPRTKQDIERMQAVIREAAEAAKTSDGDVEVNIDFE